MEDKILAFIQFLYFKKPPQEGALEYALNLFEKNVVQIISNWHFKPRGEPDVLPSLEASKSALERDFLKKRPVFSETEIKELTERLEYCLSVTVDQVKARKEFSKSVKPEGKQSHSCFRLGLAEKPLDNPIPTNEISPTKSNRSKRQSSLATWLRSKSELEPAKGGIPPAQHPPSSDDYPDCEMVELMVNADAMDTSSAVPTQAADARRAGKPEKLEQSSSSEEIFETPPTTPPRRKTSTADRKRAHPDSMQAPPPRNVARKVSSEKSAQEVSGLIASRRLIYFTKD